MSAAETPLHSLRGFTMGSTWSAQFRPAAGTPPAREVERALQARLDDLERQMSTWRTDSAVSRFNASHDTNWFPIPRDTAFVVREAIEVSRFTDGAFDVTVFPLVQIWGFGPGGGKGRVPAAAEIAAALRRVGWRKLEVRLDPPALRKSQPDLAIDLSAVGPGHASDCLGELLEARGVRDYLVEVGGEFRARGHGSLGPGWRVGVERAHDAPLPRSLAATVTLVDQSLATAGDYRNFFVADGRRFSHHLDPRTGWPTESPIASATVLHGSTLRADALGTALTVLGTERARALAERERLAVFLLVREAGRVAPQVSAQWPTEAGRK